MLKPELTNKPKLVNVPLIMTSFPVPSLSTVFCSHLHNSLQSHVLWVTCLIPHSPVLPCLDSYSGVFRQNPHQFC